MILRQCVLNAWFGRGHEQILRLAIQNSYRTRRPVSFASRSLRNSLYPSSCSTKVVKSTPQLKAPVRSKRAMRTFQNNRPNYVWLKFQQQIRPLSSRYQSISYIFGLGTELGLILKKRLIMRHRWLAWRLKKSLQQCSSTGVVWTQKWWTHFPLPIFPSSIQLFLVPSDDRRRAGKRSKKGVDIVVTNKMVSIFATIVGKATMSHSLLESASACSNRWNTWVRWRERSGIFREEKWGLFWWLLP